MNVRFIRTNKAYCAIIVFLILMVIIHIIKPTIVYEESGGFRYFGVGYKNKTILPIWLVSIIVAILSYLLILVYSTV
jgi:hypothetical protein